jgi:hypothetical protein
VQVQAYLSISSIKQQLVILAQELVQVVDFHSLGSITPVEEETPGPQDFPLTNYYV